MEFINAYFLSSPASVFVAVVTFAFLAVQAWPRKQTDKIRISYPSTRDEKASDITVSKEPEIPEGWWSKRESWLYLVHISQFSKAGAYQSFDIAGFPVFLIRGKDSKIRAFHNVCRHRAYTITRKETGNSTVLGCRYHGWSYDTTGRLVKAPQFDDIPGFDKSENSLFEIHTHTTESGHVFVNLTATDPDPFDKPAHLALEEFSRTARAGVTSKFIIGQTLSGHFNWKLAASGRQFNAILHQLEQRVSEAMLPSLATTLIRMITQKNKQADSSFFPNSFFYSFESSDLWLSVTFLPSSETTTQVRYDLFSSSSEVNTKGNDLANVIEDVMENLVQCIQAEYRTMSDGPVESSQSTGRILRTIQEHSKIERMKGGQILPAMHKPKGSMLFQQAEQLCKEIECSGPGSNGSSSGGLDW
ncbi:uncharacterized protein N7477_004598 [Penicillium maclennaniae]|uniref:uncharacterized protein n=1 Tax=Penicillium maclennaniae TaxID=1343394 RepID=UPI00254003EA|nr:uncharacterized protein N7477_004598 [Penicillium maclennaniae]KAJ5674664.1 hypothetical protein N7477_004598 [Penicillium maclennaniae]